MKFFTLVTLSLTALYSVVSASYYKASRITYYGGPGDEYSILNPFCQDYSTNVPNSVSNIDYYVALSTDVLNTYTAKSYCGLNIRLTNAENGKSLTALVVDSCRSCGYGNVDLSVEAFRYLSDNQLSKGVLKQVSWCIEGSNNEFQCPSTSSSSNAVVNNAVAEAPKKTTTVYIAPQKTTTEVATPTTITNKAGGIYIQLEKGKRSGEASISTSLNYYSGDGFIKFNDPVSRTSRNRTRVGVNVDMKAAGKYSLYVKFNNPNSEEIINRVKVNYDEYSIHFQPTGEDWMKIKVGDVYFQEGFNYLEVRATDGYMSFDYLYIE